MSLRFGIALLVVTIWSTAAAAEAVIAPGEEKHILEMLGGDRKLGGNCVLGSASIEKSHVVARYDCTGRKYEIELRARGGAQEAVETEKFAIIAKDAPPALRTDVVESVRAHEADFHWSNPATTPAASASSADPGRHDDARAPKPSEPAMARDAWLALFWLVPLLAVVVALRGARISKGLAVTAAISTALAVVVRFWLPSTPANYFTDILGPANAVSIPFVPRGAGLHGLYRQLSGIVPLSSKAIFAIQRLLGSFSVGLVVLAVGLAPRPARSAAGTPKVWSALAGALFALDPMQAWLASSDAMHVPALFAFAAGALLYVSALGESASWWRLALLFLCAAIPGLTRVELALAPLAYPVVFGRRRGRPTLELLMVAAVATAASVSLKTSFTSSVEGPSLARFAGWTRVLRGSFAGGGDYWVSQGLIQVTVVGAVVGLFRRRPRIAVALTMIVGMHAIRILSPLAGAPARGALAYARHDIVHGVLLCVTCAWALCELVDAVESSLPRRAVVGSAMAILALWIFVQRASFRRETYTFQAEYRFLAEELKHVDPACRVVTVWHPGVPGVAFESALAEPHPVLAYDAPKRPWSVVAHLADLQTLGPGCSVFFESSFCQLARESAFTEDVPQTREILDSAHAACEALLRASRGTIAEQHVDARALLWPYQRPEIPLALHRLDLTR